MTRELVVQVLDETMAELGAGHDAARELFEQVALAADFPEFLTLGAYPRMP